MKDFLNTAYNVTCNKYGFSALLALANILPKIEKKTFAPRKIEDYLCTFFCKFTLSLSFGYISDEFSRNLEHHDTRAMQYLCIWAIPFAVLSGIYSTILYSKGPVIGSIIYHDRTTGECHIGTICAFSLSTVTAAYCFNSEFRSTINSGISSAI